MAKSKTYTSEFGPMTLIIRVPIKGSASFGVRGVLALTGMVDREKAAACLAANIGVPHEKAYSLLWDGVSKPDESCLRGGLACH